MQTQGHDRVWDILTCKQATESAYLAVDYLWSGRCYVRVGVGMWRLIIVSLCVSEKVQLIDLISERTDHKSV